MTERRTTYHAGEPAPPPEPLGWLACPCQVNGRPCGQNLLPLLSLGAGDAEEETVRVVCTLCRQAVIIPLKRAACMVVVEARPFSERGGA